MPPLAQQTVMHYTAFAIEHDISQTHSHQNHNERVQCREQTEYWAKIIDAQRCAYMFSECVAAKWCRG